MSNLRFWGMCTGLLWLIFAPSTRLEGLLHLVFYIVASCPMRWPPGRPNAVVPQSGAMASNLVALGHRYEKNNPSLTGKSHLVGIL